MSYSRSVLDVSELNASGVYVKVGPVLRVQAVLTGAAELVTEFVPRGADVMGCRFGIILDLLLHI